MSRRQLTNLETEELVSYYKDNNTLADCTRKFNISQAGATSILKKNLIPIRTYLETKGVTREVEDDIISYFTKGNSADKCIKDLKLRINSQTIYNILERRGIEFRNPKHRTYFFNERYFEKIDSKEKAYWLGWIVTDGCNHKNGISIGLTETDSYILTRFSKDIGYKGKLSNGARAGEKIIAGRKVNCKNITRLRLSSTKLSNDLINLGVIPRKSHFTYFPDIPEEFYSHFIRGLWDGDGTIFINEKKTNTMRACLTGNITLLQKVQEILMKECLLSKTVMRTKDNTTYLSYGGNKQVVKIREYLYKDCEDLYLIRKKEKFDKTLVIEKIEKKCNICGDKHRGKGFCTKHYMQYYLNKKKNERED